MFNNKSGFNEFFNMVNSIVEEIEKTEKKGFTPKATIIETEESFLINLDLPGVEKEDIKISITEGKLIIKGERKATEYKYSESLYGEFEKVFPINEFKIDKSLISSKMKNGVLEIKLMKKEKEGETIIDIEG
jgi:HSP20 family protein